MAVFRKNYDYFVLFSLLVISFVGILLIYSSDYNISGTFTKNEYIKQIFWVLIGFTLIYIIGKYDLEFILNIVYPLYFFLIALLIFTHFFGIVANGARSWIGIWKLGGQPSEFGKIIIILVLSKFYSERKNTNDFITFSLAFLMILPIILLVLIQPDFGTSIIYFVIFLFISFFAGINIYYILFFTLVGFFSIFFAMIPVWYEYKGEMGNILYLVLSNDFYFKITGVVLASIFLISLLGFFISKNSLNIKFIYSHIFFINSIFLISIFVSKIISKGMKPYQIKRFLVFLDPNIDSKGAGWNLNQVKVAIGSGGLLGKGFLKGPYTHANYVPSQSTDFIFSILAEEFGFLGVSIIIGLFFFIFFRFLSTINKSNDSCLSLILSGILGLLFFHTAFNIGMSLGLLPITGIPLPFLSYGGSSTITFFLAMAFYFNIESIFTMD